MVTRKPTIAAFIGALAFLALPIGAISGEPPPVVIRASEADPARAAAERARELRTAANAETAAGWLVLASGLATGGYLWSATDGDMRLERAGATAIGVGISLQGVGLLIDAGKKRREARRIRATWACR